MGKIGSQNLFGETTVMYDRIQHLRPKSFKRKCGVRRDTFRKMVEVLKPKLTRSGKRGGQGKFRVEDQLLIAMEYWREYRTHFHIGQSWGIHKTTVGRIVRKIETILIQSGEFSLPGKKICVNRVRAGVSCSSM